MAKVTNYIPEPKPEYDVENQKIGRASCRERV